QQDLPFEKMVGIIRPARGATRMGTREVKFRLQSAAAPPFELTGLVIEPRSEFIDTGTSKFDLALELAPDGSGDSFFEYNTDLFERATITRIVGEFEQALTELLRQPDVPLAALEVLSQLGRRTRTMEKISDKPKMKSLKDFKRKA